MAGKFTLEAVFRAVDKMSAPVRRMAMGLDKFQKKASKGLADLDASVSKVTGSLKTMAATAAVIGAAAGAVALNVGKTGADFEQAITNVGAVSLLTRDQIADLEKKALELGATTKFSATEVANAMEMMGKAGFENSEILSGVGGILAAAAADGAGLEETASNISNVLKGMGLATSESARVADVLALASARTNSSISSLGESMKNVSATASQLKVPLEDTVGMVALLQDVGLDASEAGSALNTMLTQMSAPSDAATAKMKKLGVSFKDASGNMLSPAEVLGQLAKAADKSGGNMEQVAFFAELVGLRGQKAAISLQKLFKSGKVGKLVDELKGAAGSAEKMAAIRMDTLMGDIETLGGSVDSLKIALFNTQSGPLRGIVKGMTEWLDANQELIKSGVVQFIDDAIPVLKGFAEGASGAFKESLPYIKGAASALSSLFGDSAIGAQANAYFWGKRVVYLGMAIAGLVVVTKLASAATFAFGVVTKGLQASLFLLNGVVKAGQAALFLWRVSAHASVMETIALQFASKAAAADMVIAKVAAWGAAGGFQGLAVAAGAAAFAIGAIYAAWTQLSAFMDENGGWEGLKAFVGLGDGTNNWGFEGVNDVMNDQARERAAAQERNDRALGRREPTLSEQAPTQAAAIDRMFGVPAQSPVASYGFAPQPAQAAPSPTAPQPQVSTPWDGMNPADMKDLFKGSIDVNIKDPGNNVESVDVKNAGKGIAPVNPRSGTNN